MVNMKVFIQTWVLSPQYLTIHANTQKFEKKSKMPLVQAFQTRSTPNVLVSESVKTASCTLEGTVEKREVSITSLFTSLHCLVPLITDYQTAIYKQACDSVSFLQIMFTEHSHLYNTCILYNPSYWTHPFISCLWLFLQLNSDNRSCLNARQKIFTIQSLAFVLQTKI